MVSMSLMETINEADRFTNQQTVLVPCLAILQVPSAAVVVVVGGVEDGRLKKNAPHSSALLPDCRASPSSPAGLFD
jgi:hypothetical protein